MSRDVPYPYAFLVISTLVNNACIRMGRFWDISNLDCERSKSKWLAKGNPEEMPCQSDSNCHEGVTWHSPSESALVCIHTYYTLFPHNKYLTCFSTFHLCGNSFLQNPRAKALSQTTGLVAKIQSLTAMTRPQSLTRNQSPASNRCRPRPPEINQSSAFQNSCLPRTSAYDYIWTKGVCLLALLVF